MKLTTRHTDFQGAELRFDYVIETEGTESVEERRTIMAAPGLGEYDDISSPKQARRSAFQLDERVETGTSRSFRDARNTPMHIPRKYFDSRQGNANRIFVSYRESTTSVRFTVRMR